MTIIGGFTLAFFDAMIGMLLYLYNQYANEKNTDGQNYTILMTCICIMFFMFTSCSSQPCTGTRERMIIKYIFT